MYSSLLADSLAAMLLAALAPEGWAAMAVVIAAAVAAQRRADRDPVDEPELPRSRWLVEQALLLVVPVAILAASSLMNDSETAGRRDMNTVFYAVAGVVAVQLALGCWLIWRHRQRWLATVLITGALCWWTLGTAVIANMALTDNWL
jgi:hypothetical protein